MHKKYVGKYFLADAGYAARPGVLPPSEVPDIT